MHKTILYLTSCIICLLIINGCNDIKSVYVAQKPKTIYIQPLNSFSKELSNMIADTFKVLFKDVKVLANFNLPKNAFYVPRQRFRADSTISILKNKTQSNGITIGLIATDISTTKVNVTDWGVMGLGFCPGKACVISTFRLNRAKLKTQLIKVCLHEYGHTKGLPHCKNASCYMRDAEGKNITDSLIGFCKNCSKKIY
jgi:archaemetzincin